MTRTGKTLLLHRVSVGLALVIVFAGWVVSMRSLFGQALRHQEEGTFPPFLQKKTTQATQDIRAQTDQIKAGIDPLMQEVQQEIARQTTFQATIQTMKLELTVQDQP